MPPLPQEFTSTIKDEVTSPLNGESVVISGMSGLFPQSRHVKDLSDILYNQVNPIKPSPRWKFHHPEVAPYVGTVPDLSTFDAQFFKVHYRLGYSMDAMGRKTLEQAYQAIYDAGMSPEHFNGKKVGVFIGSCFSEMEKSSFYVASSRTGFGIAGCSKTMFANRVSYWLNGKGPSMAIDAACCSSLGALEQGYLAVLRGECEAAIVGGANICLHPQSSIHYGRIMKLCNDGKTRSFDHKADGCAKSEAINILLLQKAKDAKRVYAEVLHVKSEFSQILKGDTGPKYGFYREPEKLAAFMREFYKEANVPPEAVEYVEAFGSANSEADKAELEAIEKVFCKDRDDALLVGSVMSNIGYGEAASGISAVTKVLLGYQKGEIAPNLHCDEPRTDVAALNDGRMQIVTNKRGFRRSYTAVNGLSVTGVNAHVLLHGHYKPKDLDRYKSSIPRLVTVSGRQDTSVKKILDDLKSRPIDAEEIALLHNIHDKRIQGHLGRGYTILGTNEENTTVSLVERSDFFDDTKRPIWFVYSGMGSQWAGMGAQLMRIPVFAAAIERCQKVLEPKGVDVMHIITSPDKTIYDNILNSFVGIAAVQIGLTDVLTSIGIVPEMIIGHSVGELGCAYADGCFTSEEMILSAYFRGLVSVQTPFIRGSMAAIGIGYQQIVNLIPSEIEVACRNGPESCTISGPAEKMKEFVAELTAKGIFAKEVPCSNIAYHSRYISEAGPSLLKHLKEVIKNPKVRSKRWLSTSVPQDRWDETLAKTSSAEYHTNNLLNTVLFEETSRLIPSNAVLVEVAPHSLLQAILKRSLPESCQYIAMTRRGNQDNALLVLDAIGKLYMEGYNMNLQALYPTVEFPVSTGTPLLSHLVEWSHSEKWQLSLYLEAHRKTASSCTFIGSYHDDEFAYLRGNVIRGKTVFPFSGALVAVWDTFAMFMGVPRKQLSVQFHDVHLFAQPTLHDRRQIRLNVTLHRGTGKFEVMDEDRIIVTGTIIAESRIGINEFLLPIVKSNSTMDLTSDDVYQHLYDRDYHYKGDFRSIYSVNSSVTEAQIIWNDNWVTFLDGLIQLNVLRHDHEGISQPCEIRKICIDTKRHLELDTVETNINTVVLKANILDIHDTTRCGGVAITNIKFKDMTPLNVNDVTLKTLKFVPHFKSEIDAVSALQIYIQMVSENLNKDTIKMVGIVNHNKLFNYDNCEDITTIINDVQGIKVIYKELYRDKILTMRDYFLTEADLILVQNLSSDNKLCQLLYRIVQRDKFFINSEDALEQEVRPSTLFKVIAALSSDRNRLDLLKWRPTQTALNSNVMTLQSQSDLSLLKTTLKNLTLNSKLVIVSPYPCIPGLKEIVKQWRKEENSIQVHLVMISATDHIEELPELDLAFNILNDSLWGGEYYVSQKRNLTVGRGLTLHSTRTGNMNSLRWVETPEVTGFGVPVTVHFAAINDIDAKKAYGVIFSKQNIADTEQSLGGEFSGITDSGVRVMGIAPNGAASERIKARPELLWPVPDHWSLEDAATVPLAYSYAFYCLAIKTELQPGQTVLVHGGAGAFGQAVISIALNNDCTVFTTVSDNQKKNFLLRLFPKLQANHVGNSRDSSFGDLVMLATKGNGCDIVICAVKGRLKHVSLSCCGERSIMMDLAQIVNKEIFYFGMGNLKCERNYIQVDLLSIHKDMPSDELTMIQQLICEGISKGYVRPLSRITYAAQDVSHAFRLLTASRHRGRVVLRMRDHQLLAQPRLSCSPELCHLLVCNDDGFGLQFADRLIMRGARKLMLHFNEVPSRLALKSKMWEKSGVRIKVSVEELNSSKAIVTLLSECNQLGSVEGIYIIATNVLGTAVDKMTDIVAGLDVASRTFCPSAKYFAVFNRETTLGHQTCLSRLHEDLPITILNLPGLLQVQDNKDVFTWRAALDAIEVALRSPRSVLLAQFKRIPQMSLLQNIAQIAEISISDEIAGNVTLSDLDVDQAKVPAIYAFLCDVHNVSLSEELIPKLSVQQIRDLEEITAETSLKEVHGLSTFFSFVDSDELQASTEMVFLPTFTSSAMREDEIDTTQTYMYIVPGLEGHHNRFKGLCEQLKLPVLVLQPGLDRIHETPQETAERYVKSILKKTNIKEKFYLLGYEYGILLTLEMAAILESQGLTGKVFCIGSSPEEFQDTLEKHLKSYTTEEHLQNAVVRHMFSLMTDDTDGLDKALEDAITWQEKIETSVRTLIGKVAHSAQFAHALLDAAYTLLQKARSYKLRIKPLRSQIILLNASSHNDLTTNVEGETHILRDNSLQQYTQRPLIVEQLHAPLAHAITDLRCPAIINRHLDEHLLNAFNERNLCETYLLNAETFMSPVDELE